MYVCTLHTYIHESSNSVLPGLKQEKTNVKYIQATKFGGPEVLTLLETQTPTPGDGMLLVEVKAAGVNYLDLAARSGFYPQIPAAPFSPGFEIVGVVKSVGNGVEGFKEGDSVAAITMEGGGYATHIVIPAAATIPLPPGLDPANVAALLVQGLTAYMLLEETKVKAGDAVLISAAAGGLGSIAVQLAKAKGATVIGLASKSKFGTVKQLGADFVVDYNDAQWAASVREAVGSQGVQVYLDSIGDPSTEAFSLLSTFGHWIVFGARSAGKPLPPEAIGRMIEENITLRGYNLGASLQHIPRALGDLFKFFADGTLKIEITNYPLADAAKVHTLFGERKTTGKVVLIP